MNTVGNLVTIDVEIAKQSEVITAYTRPDGHINAVEMTHVLDDYFEGQTWLDDETVYWVIEQFLQNTSGVTKKTK